MKINEKNVVSFAMCNSPVDKAGLLLKRGEVNKGFQKRWFILKGNLLFYLEKRGDEPIGVIILEGCTVELTEPASNAYTFAIVFPGPSSRSYVLAADNQEEMESWMKAITCAGYEYMKLMVSELQRQLDDHNRTATLSGFKRNQDRGQNLTEIGTLQVNNSCNNISEASTSSNEIRNTNMRFNPFDNLDETIDEEDRYSTAFQQMPSAATHDPPEPLVGVSNFGNSSFFSEVSTPLMASITSSRSFEEMHEIFGQQIVNLRQSMMLEVSDA